MTITKLTANDGGQCVTAANIHSIKDGAGVLFWTCQEGYSGRGPEQVVYRIDSSGQRKVTLEKTVTGRGQFSIIDGALFLNAWNEAEGKIGYIIPVPGWTPYPPSAGVDPTRVAALEQTVAQQQQQIAALIATISGIDSEWLSTTDRITLDWGAGMMHAIAAAQRGADMARGRVRRETGGDDEPKVTDRRD